MTGSALRDRRILVVEDEYLIAMMLRDGLEDVGSVVVGPVPSVEKAIKTIAADPNIDAAILDINLGGVMAYPVAETLIDRNIPFVFTSGYEDDMLRGRFPNIRNCHKPYLFPDMEEALTAALSGSADYFCELPDRSPGVSERVEPPRSRAMAGKSGKL
jgi:CheY-like chemotaxis protein